MKKSSLDGQRYDVIVCGAGSGGFAAACAAAKTGAKTLLLERYGFSGGILTASMIHTFDAVKSCADNDQIVVGGIAGELLALIREMGGYSTLDNPPEALTVHPEIQKIAMDRLYAKYGVSVLYYAPVIDALRGEDGRVVGVEASLRDGRARFYGSAVVDGTGDAEIAYYADAACEVAQDIQALTSHFRMGNVAGGYTWTQWEELTRKAVNEAHRAGEIGGFGGPWVIRMYDNEISLNAARVYGNPVDPVALTKAEMEGRECAYKLFEILKRRVPQLKDATWLSGCSQLHIRESRIVQGDYVLTEEDIKNGAQFKDAIAMGAWPVDIHPTNGFVGVHPHKENPPLPYQIPYRCLLPRGVEGLLVVGKPISTTHRAHGSTRVPGTSLATGHAAGVAAALSVQMQCTPRQVDCGKLQEVLQGQGAVISAAK